MVAKRWLLFFTLFFTNLNAHAHLQYNLPSGVTSISHDIYNLHMTVIYVCAIIGAVVFGVLTYSIIHFRKDRGAQAATFHEHFWLEITWTLIPVLILIIIAIPGTKVLIHLNDTSQPDLTIKITGYQWKWRYEYLDQKISFFSNLATPADELSGKAKKNPNYLRQVDHPLVVPIHKKIRFLVTSNDVIHAWAVPAFGVKRDAVPGFINESWARINRPGTYFGQCVELCGINHAYMPIVVIALAEKDFEKWVAQQKGGVTPPTSPTVTPTLSGSTIPSVKVTTAAPSTPTTASQISQSDLLKKGEQLYLSTCAACHKPDGTGMPPVFPSLKDSPYTKGPLADHMNRVLNGKPGTAMQAFRDQFNDEELAAIITFERNAWGNHSTETVQPEQIKAARELAAKP